MLLRENELYEFGPFRLNVAERTLSRSDGEPVRTLPEKAFVTLSVLVRNSGRLMSKAELMNEVWPDSFVEENNLDKAIHNIRHVLGDSAAEPKYIATVRKHGYRFVAEVTPQSALVQPEDTATAATGISTASEGIAATGSLEWLSRSGEHAFVSLHTPEPAADAERIRLIRPIVSVDGGASDPVPAEESVVRSPTPSRRLRPIAVLGFAALIVTGIFGLVMFLSGSRSTPAPILSAPFSVESLSSNGRVFVSAISPDGGLMYYARIEENGSESIWVRDLANGQNEAILPATDNRYLGFQLSPDGQTLYFTRVPASDPENAAIFSLAIQGGEPRRLNERAQGWLDVSPDGRRIAFVRCLYLANENCSLWTANATDGSDERKLAIVPKPIRIRDVAFSPDGSTLAFSYGQSESAGLGFTIAAIELSTGTRTEVLKEPFFNIPSIAWLPDGRSIVFTASRIPNRNYRIWQLDLASGKAEKLSRDSQAYHSLSIDRTGSRMIATTVTDNFNATIFDPDTIAERLRLEGATEGSFAADGRIVFRSSTTANSDIWRINLDGTDRRQLTSDASDDTSPLFGPDNQTVYFTSNRSGSAQVWRMNADGTGESQLTRSNGGFVISVTENNKWVFYHHETARTLWRVSTETGTEEEVFDTRKSDYTVSPDGTKIAYFAKGEGGNFVHIYSLAERAVVGRMQLPEGERDVIALDWIRNGSGLMFVSTAADPMKNSLWFQPFAGARTARLVAKDLSLQSPGSLSVSVNGDLVFVSTGSWLHDAVLISGLKQ